MAINRIILGRQTDGGLGLRCSPSGVEAGMNPVQQQQLSFNSDWASMAPVFIAGTVQLNKGSSTNIGFSDLGYIPFVKVLTSGGDGWYAVPELMESYANNNQGSNYLGVQAYSNTLYLNNQWTANLIIAYAVFKLRAF